MTSQHEQLSREREQLLNELGIFEKDPVKLAKLVEYINEDHAPAAFQRRFTDVRGNEVNMDLEDIQGPVNYLIQLKDRENFISVGGATIRLNRGIVSKIAGVEWVQDYYVGTDRFRWHTKDPGTDKPHEAMIMDWVLKAPALKRLIDHEQQNQIGGP